ncbi:MAG: hypothetical protein P8X91_00665 [Candidatus Bathyarchaeota archaeon]
MKLTSARQEFGANFSTEETYGALVKGFTKTLNVKFSEGELTEYEQNFARRIRKERFVTEDWTFFGKSST